MDEHYYLYAFTRADCLVPQVGPGVDPRFPVELVRATEVAAVVSLVGLDQFDVTKLQGESTDVKWLSEVAVRHNQIIAQVAGDAPVLPLRLGAIFQSRSSLLASMACCQPAVAEFLHDLGDRREWAAKIYLDARCAADYSGECDLPAPSPAAGGGAGVQYLTRKREQQQRHRARQQSLKQEVAALESALVAHADRHCPLRPLPAALTGRPDKMLWNAAFLLAGSATAAWLALVETQRRSAAPKGLLLEVTGPWPPYHFCPAWEE
jgi:hypothetical protein